MNSLRISLLTMLIIISSSVSAQLKRAIDQFAADSAFTHASVSICFRDNETGRIISSLNEEMALGSASLMKLVTTAAAMEILGPDFTFKTRVGYTGRIDSAGTLNGFIILKGGGDPALGSERFTDFYGDFAGKWKDAITAAGIKRVNGRVITDASIFDYFPVSAGWSWSDLGNYYGAGAHGLSISDNMYRIHFSTGAENSIPLLNYIEPEIPGLVIKNLLLSRGDTDRGFVFVEPYGNFAEIRGTIPANRKDFILKAAIPDPPLYASTLLEQKLKESGISFTAPATTLRQFDISPGENDNSTAVVLISTSSPHLKEIIRITNIESINLFAEHLLRMIPSGIPGQEPGREDMGIGNIYNWLEEIGIGSDGLYMTDGSGLSRYNAMSSSFITGLLRYMKNESDNSAYFVSSLPTPGAEGTLKYYFNDSVFKERMVAKSGTSTRIRNYAGYLRSQSGREYSFAILVNNFDCSTAEVTRRIEKLLKTAIEF